MFMLKRTHLAEVKKLKAEIARTGDLLTHSNDLNRKYVTAIERLESERDEARAELAPLKAARDRANANLVAANARRRAGAQKERA